MIDISGTPRTMVLYGTGCGPKGDRNEISMMIKGELIIPRNLASSVTEPDEIGGQAFHLPEETEFEAGISGLDVLPWRSGQAHIPPIADNFSTLSLLSALCSLLFALINDVYPAPSPLPSALHV